MPSHRLEQLAELMRAELSELLLREVKDPRLGFVTITHIKVSGDLAHARVQVSSLGDEREQRESLAALRSAAGFLRRELGQRIRVRTIPQLDFRLDHSMEEAEKVQRTLLSLAPELAAAEERERREREEAEAAAALVSAEGTEGATAGTDGEGARAEEWER